MRDDLHAGWAKTPTWLKIAGGVWLGLRLHRFVTSRTAGRVPGWLQRVLDFALWEALWTGASAPLVLALARARRDARRAFFGFGAGRKATHVLVASRVRARFSHLKR